MSYRTFIGHHSKLRIQKCFIKSGPGIVTKPDTEVLDLERLLLTDLLHRDNLSSGLLELPQLPKEVPEAGLGHNLVSGEDPHPVRTQISTIFIINAQTNV